MVWVDSVGAGLLCFLTRLCCVDESTGLTCMNAMLPGDNFSHLQKKDNSCR